LRGPLGIVFRGAACAAALALTTAVAGAAELITVAGSSTLLPLVSDAAAAFQKAHTDVVMVVSGGGSRAAIAQLEGKLIDMAASDVPPSTNGDLVDHHIAVIAFAIAVDPRSGVKNLTRAQIADVFAGRVTNWKDVGGNDLPIVVINRPPGSGVRDLVAQYLMGGAQLPASTMEDEATSSLIDDLRNHPGSIGYASLGGLRDSGLTLVGLDGVAATDENVENGSYPLWAYEHMVTNGQPTRNQSRFLAELETNRTLLREHGYIPVHDMKGVPAPSL
jgi:phosphate transport system substrate-binding protein